ncbi:hypothetical protein STBA_70690 [Streptomyces sp. MP131-18]|nr:hypothetical protein STBA_70690 [Streptomyces sp. MP131-18]
MPYECSGSKCNNDAVKSLVRHGNEAYSIPAGMTMARPA